MKNVITRRVLLALTLITLFAPLFAQEEGEGKFEANPKERQEWFYHQRAFPLKHTPPGAHRRAFGQAMEMRINEEAARRAIKSETRGEAASLGAWTFIGPQPADESGFGYGFTSGRVTAIAVDPTTSGASTVIYVGGAEGGVWKSSNNGSTWTPLTDTQSTLAIGSITIDPNNHLSIYAGTGEENFSGDSYYGGGILHSSDGGSTWTMLGASTFGGPEYYPSVYGGSYIGAVAVEPNVTSGTPILLAASEFSSSSAGVVSGLWRSTDGGSTWSHVGPGSDYLSMATCVFWVSKTEAYAAMSNEYGGSGEPEGVYMSTDSGATWTAVNGSSTTALPVSNASAGRITLVPVPGSTTSLYVSIADNSTSGLLGMYKTTNSGTAWTEINSPLGFEGLSNDASDFCGEQCWYDMAMAVSPSNTNYLYVGGSLNYSESNGGVYVSSDGGTTWSTPNPGTNHVLMHPDFHAFAFNGTGSAIYIGNDGGVWSSTSVNSTSMSLTDLNSGLGITEFYPGLAIFKGNKGIALNGTQDNGAQAYTSSNQWTVVACGDGAWAAIDPTNSSTQYVGCTAPGNSGPWRTTNAWTAATLIDSGLSYSSGHVAFIPPMIMDPNTSTTLYYGTDHLYRMTGSTGSSPSWSLVNSSALSSQYLTTIAVAPSNSSVIFVGGSDGAVSYTTDGGTSFTSVTSILPTSRYVTMVQGDPKSATTFYVTFSGFSGYVDSVGHVFQCTTGTNACTDISGNLPNSPANDIVVDPDLANTYYVATDVGVFYTTNGGSTWATAGSGLPTVAVVGLKLHEGSRTLRAATHGRGTWDLSVPASSGTPASITSPANDSKFSSSTVTFNWSGGVNVSEYELFVGTSAGAHDLDFAVLGSAVTSKTVTNMPTNGEAIYVTLYSLIGSTWTGKSYTYAATGTGTQAIITSPANNSKFTSSSVTFNWSGGVGISKYILWIGTQPSGDDIAFIQLPGTATNTTVTMPTNGENIYVTMHCLNGFTYLNKAYVYQASGTGAGAAITSPTNGSTFSGSSVTFDWSGGVGISKYILWIGTSPGSDNIAFIQLPGTATATTYNSMPTNGEKIYVTLSSENGVNWLRNGYTYTAASGAEPPPQTDPQKNGKPPAETGGAQPQ